MSPLRRETFLLSLAASQVLDDNYVGLLRGPRVLHARLTNLRNRPLDGSHVCAMSQSILSLYHNLLTGSRDFPLIPCIGSFHARHLDTPFPCVRQSEKENATPPPVLLQPAGVMVPAAGSSSAPPNILTPVHPEKVELAALRVDRRNRVRSMEIKGTSFTRVISTVYRTEDTELSNCWKVSHYSADGRLLMSALCKFTSTSVQLARALGLGKRKDSRGRRHQQQQQQQQPGSRHEPLRV